MEKAKLPTTYAVAAVNTFIAGCAFMYIVK